MELCIDAHIIDTCGCVPFKLSNKHGTTILPDMHLQDVGFLLPINKLSHALSNVQSYHTIFSYFRQIGRKIWVEFGTEITLRVSTSRWVR